MPSGSKPPTAPQPPALPVVPKVPEAPKVSADPHGIEPLHTKWKETQKPKDMAALLKGMRPLIESQLGRYKGTLPPAALRGQAKKFAIQAVRNFDPTKGAKLTTHVVNGLQQLHRKNYEAQSAFRLSEELQRGVGAYQRSQQNLQNELGREATAEELAQDLAWPLPKVQRMARQSRGEVSAEDLLYDPADPYQESYDPVVDLVYHDLAPKDKLIMELATGYGGKAKMAKKDIAAKLGISPARVSQRSLKIATKIREATEAF